MKLIRPRKILVISVLVIVCIAFYFRFFTPHAWRWNTANLQVHVHTVAYDDPVSGQPRWDEMGFGWRKRDFLLSGWFWRNAWGDNRHGGTESTKVRIVGVTPSGVSVKVVHHDSRGGAFNFEKTVFVRADARTRIDVSDQIHITGYFDAGNA